MTILLLAIAAVAAWWYFGSGTNGRANVAINGTPDRVPVSGNCSRCLNLKRYIEAERYMRPHLTEDQLRAMRFDFFENQQHGTRPSQFDLMT